jgi:hypothetical protein
MKTAAASVDGLLRTAIELIRFTYKGFSSEPLPNWRWALANSISDLDLLNRTFAGRRPTASGKHHRWDRIFMRVEPPEEEGEQ